MKHGHEMKVANRKLVSKINLIKSQIELSQNNKKIIFEFQTLEVLELRGL